MLVIPAQAGPQVFKDGPPLSRGRHYSDSGGPRVVTAVQAVQGSSSPRFRRSKGCRPRDSGGPMVVVPAKAGIQFFLRMGPRLRGGDVTAPGGDVIDVTVN